MGPQKWVFGVFPLDLSFLMSSGFLGIFWLNLTKSGFLRHCGFSPHFITSLLTSDDTKFNGTETAVVMIFILLLLDRPFCERSILCFAHVSF